MAKSIRLGREVKDKVTGFKGIAVSKTQFLQGCCRIEVLPTIDKDGKLQDIGVFDEPQLEVVGPGIIPEPKERKQTGGPHSGNNPSRRVLNVRR